MSNALYSTYFLSLTCQCYTMQHALSVLISVPGHLQKCQKLFTSSCLSSRSQRFLWPFALIWGLVLFFPQLRHFFLYLSLVLLAALHIFQSFFRKLITYTFTVHKSPGYLTDKIYLNPYHLHATMKDRGKKRKKKTLVFIDQYKKLTYCLKKYVILSRWL